VHHAARRVDEVGAAPHAVAGVVEGAHAAQRRPRAHVVPVERAREHHEVGAPLEQPALDADALNEPGEPVELPRGERRQPGLELGRALRERVEHRVGLGDEDAGVPERSLSDELAARSGAGFSTKRATRRGAVRTGIIGAGGGAGGSTTAPAAAAPSPATRSSGTSTSVSDSDATRGSPSTADDTSASSEPDDVVSSSAASGASAGA
jgi:hypothetical protein